MTSSLPSKKIIIVDAPEPEAFKCDFIYNYYTTDEKINEINTESDVFLSSKQKQIYDKDFIEDKNFQNKVPRYVKFSWKPVIKNSQKDSYLSYYKDRNIIDKISIKNNINKIQSESTFSEKKFLNIEIQDKNFDKKINFFVRRALNELNKNNGSSQESIIDIARELSKITEEEMKGNFIAQALYQLNKNGIKFIDKTNREKVQNTIIEKIQDLKFNTKLNNKFLQQFLISTKENISNPFSDEFNKIFDDFSQIQNEAIQAEDSSYIFDEDYDFILENYINVKKVDANFDTVVIPIGYIIEKYEINANSEKVVKESIIIENPFTSVAFDEKIKYGSKYSYKIKTICYVETTAIDQNSGDILAVSFLISSKTSEEKIISCEEFVPPPSPADFNIIWNYSEKLLTLIWSFPLNQQRDIKYFQIFKRNNINEPFQLLKMYDFNDSEIPLIFPETPEEVLVEYVDNPKCFYIDSEFTKESKAIYAVCSVDAHGFSSNYSMQFEVSFDKFKNKLNKKIISVSGAPKAYPNMFLNTDTFVDVIKDSGHKQLSVYFNPEYLQVIDTNNNDLQLLKTNKDSFYRLQIINADLQKEQIIEIKLEDRRTATQKLNLSYGNKFE